METRKAYPRRIRMGFFARFCQGQGIDVGVGREGSPGGEDKVTNACFGWDKDNGDAHTLPGIADNSLDFIHASHVLEHLERPEEALKTWLRVLKPGGWLTILLPEKSLYEKKAAPPSVWNCDHKFFYTMLADGVPGTVGLANLLEKALTPGTYLLWSLHLAADGYCRNGNDHPSGEYSFEAMIQKRAGCINPPGKFGIFSAK